MSDAHERFMSNVSPEPNTGCWLWAGTTQRGGYGKFKAGGANVAAHRYSWQMTHGPVPEGLCVLHRCDVPGCVKPEHLFVGTQKENTADMIAKGRGDLGPALTA